MLPQKVFSGDLAARESLDSAEVLRGRKSAAVAVIPHSLLHADFSLTGELGVREAVLDKVFVEGHATSVTSLGTNVNRMFADRRKRIVYRTLAMEHPNRLAELMDRRGVTGPELAFYAGTTKQQILKLRKGERKLTRAWAERLAPHLGVHWPEVIGWVGELPKPEPDPKPMLKAMGARIAWARGYHNIDVNEAARRFGMAPGRLLSIESGAVELTAIELATISSRLRVPAGFLLQGMPDDLPHKMAQDWEAHIEDLRSANPSDTG